MLNTRYIHIADDDEDDVTILSDILKLKYPEINIGVSKDGRDLLQHLITTERLPDLLFLDISMPLMTGHDSIAAIRADPKFREIKTVIYSTSGNRRDIERMYDAGADFYLEKPKDLGLLVYMIDNLFYRVFEEQHDRAGRDEFRIA